CSGLSLSPIKVVVTTKLSDTAGGTSSKPANVSGNSVCHLNSSFFRLYAEKVYGFGPLPPTYKVSSVILGADMLTVDPMSALCNNSPESGSSLYKCLSPVVI